MPFDAGSGRLIGVLRRFPGHVEDFSQVFRPVDIGVKAEELVELPGQGFVGPALSVDFGEHQLGKGEVGRIEFSGSAVQDPLHSAPVRLDPRGFDQIEAAVGGETGRTPSGRRKLRTHIGPH